MTVKDYVVGGAVRDELLGLPVKDRDYVVVGATPEEMIARASSRSARTSRYSSILAPMKSMRWREPKEKAAAATRASRSTPRPR